MSHDRREQREQAQLQAALRRSLVSARRDALRRADADRAAVVPALAASLDDQRLLYPEMELALVLSKLGWKEEQARSKRAALDEALAEGIAIDASLMDISIWAELPDDIVEMILDVRKEERKQQLGLAVCRDCNEDVGHTYVIASRVPRMEFDA